MQLYVPITFRLDEKLISRNVVQLSNAIKPIFVRLVGKLIDEILHAAGHIKCERNVFAFYFSLYLRIDPYLNVSCW
jgi:hypothetical protein